MKRAAVRSVATTVAASVFFILAPAPRPATAVEVTTTPLQFYGLGTLNCAAWSPDGTQIVTGGSAGAFLWDVATSRVIRMFIGHTRDVTAVAFSSDGSRIVTGSLDGTARLWSTNDGGLLQIFTGHTGTVNSVALSPDGMRVLTGSSDHTARLWNVADGSVFMTFAGHTGAVLSVACSTQFTRILTASADGTAKLWNTATGAVVRTIVCGTSSTCMAFSPDGTKILMASGKRAEMRNTSDGYLAWSMPWGDEVREACSVCFSSDAQTIVIGSLDGWVVFRNALDGAAQRNLLSGNAAVASVALSPDGNRLLTANTEPESVPKIWTIRDMPYDYVIHAPYGYEVWSAKFLPNGEEVAFSSSCSVQLWNITQKRRVRECMGPGSEVGWMDVSHDGTKIVAEVVRGPGRAIWQWRTADGVVLTTSTLTWGPFYGLAYSPDGAQFAYDSTVICDASNGSVIRSIVPSYGVWALDFSPDGTKLLVGGGANPGFGYAGIVSVADGTQLTTFTGHTDFVRDVALSPDGRFAATASYDGTVRVWDTSSGTPITAVSDAQAFNCVAFSPDGTAVLAGHWAYPMVRLWRISDGTLLRTYPGYVVNSVDFSPDGTKVLTGGRDGTIRIWPPDGPALVGHTAPTTAIGMAGDQGTTVVTAHSDNKVRMWNAATGMLRHQFSAHLGRINCAAVSPDGVIVLTGGQDKTANVYDVATGQIVRNHTGFDGPLNCVAFSSDGARYLTASDDGWTILWRTSDGAPIGSFSGHGGPVYGAAISRDDLRVLTGGTDNTAKLWNSSSGLLVKTFTGHTSPVRCVAFSADRSRVLTGSDDKTAKLWDANTGSLLRTFSGHTSPVISVAFSPDGSAVFTAGDKTANTWNTATGALIQTFSGHGRLLTGAVVSPDGSRIVTSSEDGTARLWPGFGVAGGGGGGGGGATGPVLNGDKFILVAGGGNYTGNPIVSQTESLADRALFTAQVRGYRRNEIRYLSAFDDWATRDSNGDGKPDADSQATTATFWSAIDTWSSGTARLFIHLVDHGTWNSVSNQWYFRLNQNDYINAHDLDAHLDTLQAATGCEVILIVDCCYSGGFVQECAPTSGTKRIVIASTTATNLAVYTLPEGAESFTAIFLSYAIMGNTIENCFRWTQTAFLGMGNPAGQTPWMDDDGDGDSDKWDGAVAARYVLGRYPAFGLNAPTITAVETTRTVAIHEPVTLWARLGEAVAAREVWALIVPQGRSYAPGQPVTDLTRVNLAYTTSTGRWEGQWRPGHSQAGRCIVTYFAVSEDSLQTRLLATPLTSGLLVVGDRYEIDDTATSATEYIFSEVPEFPPEQRHNFHDAGDADWVKFYGHGRVPYTIRVENPGTSCDAVIELYDRATTTSWIAQADNRGPGQPEELPRTLPTTGTYYVKVYDYNTAVFGEGTSYTLRLTCDTGAGLGLATALGSNRMACSWTNGLQAGDQGHNLYHKTPGASAWTLANGAPIPTNSFEDRGLQPSTLYYYMVRVVKGDGSETPPCSSIFCGVTEAPPPQPTSPTLAAEPAFTSGTSNQAAWGAVALATAYWLEWADNGAFTSAQNSGWTSATQAMATGLSDGVTYYYRVKCRSAAMVESAWSNVVSSRQDASAPQTAVGALATYQTAATFAIPWTGGDAVSGLASVRLFYRRGASGGFAQYGGAFAASPISFNSAMTGGDGDYYFYTVGTDNVGNVEAAPPAPDAQTTVLATLPPAPVMSAEPAFTAGASNQVAWSAVAVASAYYAEYDDDPAFGSPNQNSGWTAATQWTATGLADGATYYYRVKCRNAALIESGWSNVVHSRQDATLPQTAVSALSSFQTTATFNVAWSGSDAVSGVASVRLFYRRGIAGGFAQYTSGTYTASPIRFNSTTTGGDGDYYFYTVGTDNVGNVENAPATPDAQTTVLTTPSPTPVMAAEPAFTSGTSNRVAWSAVAGAAAYSCQRDTTTAFAAPTSSGWITATQWTASGLANGATYYYRARSRNAAMIASAWSNVVFSRQDATSPTAPGRPTDAGAFTSSTSVRFNWTAAGDAISGVASYDLQVGTTPGGADVLNANVGNVFTRTVTGANGQTLYARVRARDNVGNVGLWSPNSDGIMIDTTKPQMTGATARDWGSVDITFSEPVVGADVASNYTCAGGLQILQASQLSAAQYRLYTSAQTPGTQYTVQAGGAVRDRAGNALDPAAVSRKFTGGVRTAVQSWRLYR